MVTNASRKQVDKDGYSMKVLMCWLITSKQIIEHSKVTTDIFKDENILLLINHFPL